MMTMIQPITMHRRRHRRPRCGDDDTVNDDSEVVMIFNGEEASPRHSNSSRDGASWDVPPQGGRPDGTTRAAKIRTTTAVVTPNFSSSDGVGGNDRYQQRQRRRRRRRSRAMSVFAFATTTVSLLLVVLVVCMVTTTSDAFSPSVTTPVVFTSTFSSSSIQKHKHSSSSSWTLVSLQAVHARSGNRGDPRTSHHHADVAAAVATTTTSKNKKVSATTTKTTVTNNNNKRKKSTPTSTSSGSPPPSPPDLVTVARNSIHPPAGGRRRSPATAGILPMKTTKKDDNCYSTPTINNNNGDSGSDNNSEQPNSGPSKEHTTTTTTTNENNNNNNINHNSISLRLQSLLRDDTGEQEMELYPDSSREAAEQLAYVKSYSKLNDVARRKANVAVCHVVNDDDEDDVDEEEGGGGDGEGEGDVTGSRRRRRGGGKMLVRQRRGRNDDYDNIRGGRTVVVVDEATTSSSSSSNSDNGRITLLPVKSTSRFSTSTSSSSTSFQKMQIRATVKETGSDSMSTYIKSLGQHELLYKEDEVLLGRQVRILSKLEETRHDLELQLLQPPTFAQWATATNQTVPCLKRQIRKSHRAKAALIEANLRLVITVARQTVRKSRSSMANLGQHQSSASSVQFQDACQSGIVGLTRATEKFDPDLGFRFSTYATWWIQKEVSRSVSEQSRSVRIPPSAIKIINDIYIQERVLMAELGRRPRDEQLAERLGMSVKNLMFYRQSAKEVKSLDKKIDARSGKGSMSTGGEGGDGATMDIFVRDTEHASPTELVNESMLKDDIRRLVGTLSPREQAIIRLRFGLDEGSKPLGLGEISTKFGVEKEKIRKIEARALLKLRQPSRSQVVRCYISDHT